LILNGTKNYIRALKNQPLYKGKLVIRVKKDSHISAYKSWLGNYKQGVKQRAKELKFGIKSMMVELNSNLEDGFWKRRDSHESERRGFNKVLILR